MTTTSIVHGLGDVEERGMENGPNRCRPHTRRPFLVWGRERKRMARRRRDEEEAKMGAPRRLAITSPKWINAVLERLSASALYHSPPAHYLCIILDIFDHVLLIFILQQVLQAKKKEKVTGASFASAFEEPKSNASNARDSKPSLFVLPSTVQP
jgi:hypothetical protein